MLTREQVVEQKRNLRGMDLRRVDLRRVDLREADLREVDLREVDLREVDLREADLREADLREADLRGADLRGADLRGADLRRADLRGTRLHGTRLHRANLSGTSVIDAGQDLRGYRFVAVRHADGLMIAAGCRWLTLRGAQHHWRPGSTSQNAAECLRKVEMIAAEARRRGWLRKFALLSAQGTACAETVLHDSEFTEANRRHVEEQISPREPDAPVPGTWTDVTGNDAL